MPRKIRELIADLRQAGFALDRQKGPPPPVQTPVVSGPHHLSGGEGDDAKTYQEHQVTKAIADSKAGE